jgi:2-amino-4-hydroxy-6-hydroxymethyldihydropteridine diphosphokinase
VNLEFGFSLGSNLPDRLEHLQQARQGILEVPATTSLAQSSVYETEPVGVKPEYAHLAFLNSVVVVESPLAPNEWLTQLQAIEKALGRERSEDRYAPRTVDVDILYAGDLCIDSGGLTVPHPRWAERGFVMVPLAEVRADRVMPGTNKTVQEHLEEIGNDGDIQIFCREW